MDMVTERSSNHPIPYFSATRSQWLRVVGFYLLLSLAGLNFLPAWLLIAAWLVNSWRTDRYTFLVEFFILITGSGFFVSSPNQIGFFLGIAGMMVCRKDRLTKKVTLLTLAYFALLFIIASTSLESMRVQIYMMRYYMLIIALFIPLLAFANRQFDFERFFHVLVLYVLCLCGFYVVDTFIISGSLLLPGTHPGYVPSLSNLYIRPFTFPRHYPVGLYWLIPLIPAVNYGTLRLRWYHWALVILAIASARTNSLLFAVIICWVLFRPKVRQIAIYSVVAVVGIASMYFVDKATGGNMRIAMNIEQFIDLNKAADDEDLAEFGTGRMAQILPKWELLTNMHRQWLGFGFLHPEKTTNPVFQIKNDYYSNIEKSEEKAILVEVEQVQVILNMGYIGLFGQLLYYFLLYIILRHLPNRRMLLCTLIGFELLGVGGFAGLSGMHGALQIVGLIVGCMILQQKSAQKATAT